jgi:hypothetical protein
MYIYNGQNLAAGNPSAQSLTSAAVINSQPIVKRCLIKRLSFIVSTATVSSGNIVITAYYRPTVGSSSSQVSLGTITIPTSIAAGKVYYKDITPYSAAPGGDVSFSVTTAAAGGGAAGAGFCAVEFEQDPEVAANESNMVASA